MNNFYFITHNKPRNIQYTIVIAETENLAIQVFQRFSINKPYKSISEAKPNEPAKLTETLTVNLLNQNK